MLNSYCIEDYKIEGFLANLEDLIKSGKLKYANGLELISNFQDLDKENSLNPLDKKVNVWANNLKLQVEHK